MEESKELQTRNPSKSEIGKRLTEEGRAYFCSELVTKAYKVCGLLNESILDQACSNFLPGDWSSNKNSIQLTNGAKLGPEQMIFSGNIWDAEESTGEKGK